VFLSSLLLLFDFFFFFVCFASTHALLML
jgi:hypothetical protein